MMTVFRPGMRVVVVENDEWPLPRIGGTYGKVTEVVNQNGGQAFIRIDCTGHVDGGAPPDLDRLDIFPFYPEELTVVD